MGFNNFRVNLILKVILIAITIFVFTTLVFRDEFILTILAVLALVVIQVISLINFLDKKNKDIATFLGSIRYDDIDHRYPVTDQGTYLDILNREFNKVLENFQKIRQEKEAEYQYMKTIVQHVGIGLVTFNRAGEVQIINAAAKKLLNVTYLANIESLRTQSAPLVEMFTELKTGGRALVKLERGGEMIQLSIYAIELWLKGEPFKLISLQNIQSELEEKEMEAWQNLVRVLTHEIMNSVTPISSLAATVDDELMQYIRDCDDVTCSIPVGDMEDVHMAIQTIQRRSEGLIRFVSDFRNLTRIPVPKVEKVPVREMFDHLLMLLRQDITNSHTHIEVDITPADMVVMVDRELIQQVLINLVKNALEALSESEQEEPRINLLAYYDEKGTAILKVRDNGPGIDEEALNKIFIPFFTTKKSGSGIGLSLSRQIMRQHKASISARSRMDEGTEFLMKF
ncbi:PAS domain-containing sensor histidine kinase [Roseivirga sp. BDSF3-8]|uniref:sensor histidine kinase n=1 Tax=Roseivirga sp. BDSF3-8 TaxID=3241598 RepID=UPI003531D8D4